MSMNRASDAAAFDWLATASYADLEKATKAISSRLAELRRRDEEIAAQTGTVPADASPLVLHDFGFAGMARWLERQSQSDSHQRPAEDVATVKSNAKPAIRGLDIDSSVSRAGLRFTR